MQLDLFCSLSAMEAARADPLPDPSSASRRSNCSRKINFYSVYFFDICIWHLTWLYLIYSRIPHSETHPNTMFLIFLWLYLQTDIPLQPILPEWVCLCTLPLDFHLLWTVFFSNISVKLIIDIKHRAYFLHLTRMSIQQL